MPAQPLLFVLLFTQRIVSPHFVLLLSFTFRWTRLDPVVCTAHNSNKTAPNDDVVMHVSFLKECDRCSCAAHHTHISHSHTEKSHCTSKIQRITYFFATCAVAKANQVLRRALLLLLLHISAQTSCDAIAPLIPVFQQSKI
jgi:hypothetical protein